MTSPSGHIEASDPVTGLAARLLARYEPGPESASRPAYGYANEVWIGENVVVHIKRGTIGGLAREAAITAILPTDVGSPQVLDQGVTGRLEWMINRRLPGNNLKVEWPTLDATNWVAAATDLWARLRAVHRTDVAAVRAIGNTTTPFYALKQATARNYLDELLQNGTLRPSLHDRLGAVLGQMFDAMRDVPAVIDPHGRRTAQHGLGRHQRHPSRLRNNGDRTTGPGSRMRSPNAEPPHRPEPGPHPAPGSR